MPTDINVILLTADSLRPDHLGCYGYPRMTSPNIDAMVENGQLFTRAYSTSVWTIPGVMSILTSLQPPVHSVEQRGAMLPSGITTIFDCFTGAGYAVPNLSFLLTIPEFSTIRIEPPDEQYFSEDDEDEVLRWIEKNHDKKFFIWYLYRGVHLPYNPSSGARAMFLSQASSEYRSPGIDAVLSQASVVPVGTVEFEEEDRPILMSLYDGQVKDFDSFMGRLFARLRKYGLLEKTLVVITADHGEELMDHGFVGHASTMLSATLYDEVIRIPLIVSLPGYLRGGVTIGEQVQQIDIMPTVLDIAGIPIPAGVQGRSLAPLLLDMQEQNESSVPIFSETVFGGFQATPEMAETRMRSVRTDEWKLIETDGPAGKSFQLFNLLIDPRELKDVYRDYPNVTSGLRTLLAEWRRENDIRRKALGAVATVQAQEGVPETCPQFLFPYDGAVLRHRERGGMVRSAWTGTLTSTYVIEYDIGTGVYRLTGSIVTFGNKRDFGPYPQEVWNSLAARNPWRVRVSPDTQPRCWSNWIEFTFE
jgi:arylsulfatase A-like enzyme